MLRLNVPEQTFTKAIRSRWFGSMLACILKTKPVNFSSSGDTIRSSVSRGRGVGAISIKQSSISRIPKLFKAEPKNTGASCPCR